MQDIRMAPSGAGAPHDWRDQATCRNHDPELFFPEGTVGPALRQTERAKRTCESCPVRMPCLRFALRNGLGFGIWGGTTEEERRSMRHIVA
jgi:WhiB family transcriptional regulator, redox-sensing transcriptional regulator